MTEALLTAASEITEDGADLPVHKTTLRFKFTGQ